MGRFPSVGSSESSCSSEKHSTCCEADVDRVWDEGEALGEALGEGGELPRKRPGYSSSPFYRGEKFADLGLTCGVQD